MKILKGFEVRFHRPFHGADSAYADIRVEQSMNQLMRRVERVALVGGRHMAVHIGVGKSTDIELDFNRAVDNLTKLVEQSAAYEVSILQRTVPGGLLNCRILKPYYRLRAY